ncbi:MAG TPA: mannosyltransferase family protein [Actinoplanes sp.]|nr:mannosyltransferase family protein [Actinoplanes sp.]
MTPSEPAGARTDPAGPTGDDRSAEPAGRDGVDRSAEPAGPAGLDRAEPTGLADGGPHRAGRLFTAAGRWRGLAIAVGLLIATRIGQLVMLSWLDGTGRPDGRLVERLVSWDSGWFLKVATQGYPAGYSFENGELAGNGLAFFPVYPLLIRGVAALGLEADLAALAVSWTASVGAAVALHLLGTSLHDRRAGWALVVLCCAQPMSIVLSMAYSEAVFLALVAGTLVAAHRRAWWAAGLLGFGAAMTRPTGLAVALAVAAAALLAVRDHRRARAAGTAPERILSPLLAAAAALAGVPLYLGWVAWRVGDLDAWFAIQTAGWGTSFDSGANTLRFLGTTFGGGEGWVPISTALILIAALYATVVALFARPWVPLAVYGLTVLVLVYGQAGFYHSKVRLLVPVLLILLPAAVAAARARPRVAVPALAAWALFGLWYGAHMVTVWQYAI